MQAAHFNTELLTALRDSSQRLGNPLVHSNGTQYYMCQLTIVQFVWCGDSEKAPPCYYTGPVDHWNFNCFRK